MLHLVSAPTLSLEVVERTARGDDIVLQHGSLWAAVKGHADNDKLLSLQGGACQIFVLQEMLAVDGIEMSRLLAGVNIIDYPGLVELSVKNPVIHTWC